MKIILNKPVDNDVWEAAMGDSMMEKASAYDKNGLMKHEIDNALLAY